MAKIWEFFENLNAYVYVADIDTYEMVYMNRKLREDEAFRNMSECADCKCYELLQGCSTPCAICTNGSLCPGNFVEWEFYNPTIRKTLKLYDTMLLEDGRRLRLEIARDITAQVHQEEALSRYQDLEHISNEGIRLALKAPTPDTSLNIIMEYLGKALHGDRTYIFEKNDLGNDDNTYEWTAAGVEPQKENLQNVPAEACAGWYERFRSNENIFIKCLEDVREKEPEVYAILAPQDIRSLVVVPLYDGDNVIGFYGVDNPPSEMLEYASYMLQITGYFITSTLKRRNLVKQLREMSYRDQLTGLYNRHAMAKFIADFAPAESLGVVFCDITGLKRVNDTEGHAAGDTLIRNASRCLLRAFGDYRLFRIGGDELLAFCRGISEEELADCTERLRQDMKQHRVVMALGTVWRECAQGEDVTALLTEAEQLMYREKAEYYRTAGIDRRR